MTTAKTKTAAASKAKTASNGAEEFVAKGAQTAQENFEKAMKGYGDLASFGRENFDAIVESATVTTKSFEAIAAEATAYSKQSVEEGVAAAKAAFTAGSVQEVLEMQSDFAKNAFEAYIAEATKLGEMFSGAAKDAAEPLNSRMSAFVELVQGGRA